MKVILLKDVPKIGQRNTIKEISDGYANNFLIPRGLAKPVTGNIEKQVEKINRQTKEERDRVNKKQEETFKKINKSQIVISEKVNEQGHLFAGIHNEEIISEIEKQLNIKVEKDMIDLPKPIKEIGEHQIPIKFGSKDGILSLVINKKEQ